MHRTFFPPILLLTLAIVALLRGFANAAPPPPAHLALTAPSLAGQVGLTWNAATGATSYSLKRATAADGPFCAVGSPAVTSFTETTAAAGTRYFYLVTAIDGTGEGVSSLTISTTPAIVVDDADASGVTFTVEWSDTLSTNSWSAAGVTQTVLTDNGTVQTVKASIPSDGTIFRRYLRLKATAP